MILIAPLLYILLKFWHFITHVSWQSFPLLFPLNIKPVPSNLKSKYSVMLVLKTITVMVPFNLFLTRFCKLARSPLVWHSFWSAVNTDLYHWLGNKEYIWFYFSFIGFIMCLGSSSPDVYCISQQFRHGWHGYLHGQFTIYDEDNISSVWIHWQTSGNATVPG